MKIFVSACVVLAGLVGAADAQEAATPSQDLQYPIETQTIRTQAPPSTASSAPQAPNGVLLGTRACNGPINVASDNFVGNFDTKVGTYLGNVIVTRDECKLRADKVIAEAVNGNNLNRLTAVGNVVFDSSSGTATGDNGVYDLGPKTVTLTGRKVVLIKGKNVMRGTVLVVDLSTGLARLTAKGMPGGRVQSSFIPKPGANDAATVKTKKDVDN
jgi:lipopolysaccharide export system protein LptA